jgi:prepilin-type N-terminal cleavage/methylation domain-containing protein
MNKKNGFTLIELICTILLLSIIVSLVIITTVNIMQNSKERENAASMKLIEVAAKDYITQNENDFHIKNGVIYCIDIQKLIDENLLVSKIKYNGEKINDKTVKVRYDSNTYFYSLDEKGSCVGPTKVLANQNDTYKAIVYLDPTNLTNYCDSKNVTSTTGTKSGCMKWYVYEEDSKNYTMILDHNTTATYAWLSKEDYIAAGGTEENWESSRYDDSSKGPITITKKLKEDTSSWVIPARLISADEIAHIVGADREATIKWDSSKVFDSSMENIKNMDSYISWFNLNGNGNSYSSTDGWQIDNSEITNYFWLVENLGKYCTDSECLSEGKVRGYWTSTPIRESTGYSGAYDVDGIRDIIDKSNQTLGYGSISYAGSSGIRPVITVEKNLIKELKTN